MIKPKKQQRNARSRCLTQESHTPIPSEPKRIENAHPEYAAEREKLMPAALTTEQTPVPVMPQGKREEDNQRWCHSAVKRVQLTPTVASSIEKIGKIRPRHQMDTHPRSNSAYQTGGKRLCLAPWLRFHKPSLQMLDPQPIPNPPLKAKRLAATF